MKKIIYITAMMLFIVGCTSYSYGYSDINSEYWGYNDIIELSDKGILSGYPDGTFKPENNMTLAEFITILIKVMEPNADVSRVTDFWAEGSINLAKEKNIIYERDYSEFNPNKEITRREICLMLYRSIDGIDKVDIEKLSNRKKFNDISKNAEEEKIVSILSHLGVLSGYPDNTVKLNRFSTRAEVCSFINKYLKSRCILLSMINDSKVVVYENDIAVVDQEKLPVELKKWKYTSDIPYVTTTIKEIALFPFNNPDIKYKELFSKIVASEDKYMQFREKFGENNFVIAIEFETTNNTVDSKIYSGYEFLHISFSEEDISIIDAFDTDEISRQLNKNASIGEVVLPGESRDTSAFYIVNRLPESKIRFDRYITEIFNIKEDRNLPCTSFHSLIVRLKEGR